MADPTPPAEVPTPAEEPELNPAALPGAAEGRRVGHLLVLGAGVAVIAAAAGYGAAMLGGCGGAEPSGDREVAPERGTRSAEPGTQASEQFQYVDFEPITVNLDEPRLARYVCVTITLAIPSDAYGSAQTRIEEKMPVLKDWLTIYFASCSLDDVRGAVNLNRLRREILDAFNDQLWPDQKPRISHVLFKKFAVS